MEVNHGHQAKEPKLKDHSDEGAETRTKKDDTKAIDGRKVRKLSEGRTSTRTNAVRLVKGAELPPQSQMALRVHSEGIGLS